MKISLRSLKVFACLMTLVLVSFMTVEVAHNHPANDLSGARCQICAMAHIAVENHPSIFTERILHVIAAVSAGEPLPGSRMVVFTGFIRPPPASSSYLA
uniref:Lipoprotein n=1 Tax=Acidobacterium capsulatum TaxID=33075 RepID=A0A7V4XS58_9BACT